MKAMPLYSFYYSLKLCGLMSLVFSFKQATVATPTRGCSEVERDALLAFKANVKDPSHRLASWSQQIDCCKWSGVVCRGSNSKTDNASLVGGQHVVELNLQNPNIDNEQTALRGEMLSPSLLNLTRLERLNLSWNDFEGTQIPQFIGSFFNLEYLELYWSNFSGVIPPQLGNLSSLRHLGLQSGWVATPIALRLDWLSGSNFSGTIPSQLGNLSSLRHLGLRYAGAVAHRLDWLSGLSSLAYLDMSFVDLSKVPENWLLEVNMLPFLRELYLEGCGLNYINSSLSPHLNLTSLIILDLAVNDFNSTFPNWLWNLTKLSTLDLSFSNFFGPLSTEIWALSGLTKLSLSSNWLNVPILLSLANLSSLHSLFLFDCSLHGQIPSQIGNLTSLINFDLAWNSLSGPIPTEIGKLSNLRYLDLSYNSLVSVVSELHLAKLTDLKSLILKENSQITISLDYDWVPPFQLKNIDLSSCIVGPRFPQWLRSQKSMVLLSLQNTSINDILPHWFWDSTFSIIDLSQNKLRGTLPSSLEGMATLDILILSSNKLEGLIPRWPPQILVLDLSFNKFSGPLPSTSFYFSSWQSSYDSNFELIILSNNQINGSIPSYICNLNQLGGLDLSNNQLSGEIPKCWQKAATNLLFIDLGNNKLVGEIPSSLGNLIALRTLHLNNNNLGEQLPPSLQNCRKLGVLDLADNKFSGRIPKWIGQSWSQLIILSLRSNDFFGIIPPNLGELKSLQIVDLANNNLSGEIPYSFGKFNAITSSRATAEIDSHVRLLDGAEFKEIVSMSIVTKGAEYTFSSTLYLVKSVDLSNNCLIGEIPISLGSLAGLQTLNLSRNNLRGKIPYTIGGMKSLESLDLSFNNLSGVIPQELSTLTALSHLNLSYNNLSGKIPPGYQLQTLEDTSIYKGNVYLCGDIIHKNCSDHYDKHNLTVDEEWYQNNTQQLLFYLGSFVGYVTGIWAVFIILWFKKNWRHFYFRMIDKMYDKICIAIKIRMNRFNIV